MTTDFENILNEWPGKNVILTPVTKTSTNLGGDEILTDGTPKQIKVYFLRTENKISYEKAGFLTHGNAIMCAKYSDGPKFNDKVAANGILYDISAIDGNTTTISITTSTSHGLNANDKIMITNTTNYNGLYVVATAPTTVTLTIANTTHNFDAETTGILSKSYEIYRIKEALDRKGPNETSSDFIYTYISCNLFLEDSA